MTQDAGLGFPHPSEQTHCTVTPRSGSQRSGVTASTPDLRLSLGEIGNRCLPRDPRHPREGLRGGAQPHSLQGETGGPEPWAAVVGGWGGACSPPPTHPLHPDRVHILTLESTICLQRGPRLSTHLGGGRDGRHSTHEDLRADVLAG